MELKSSSSKTAEPLTLSGGLELEFRVYTPTSDDNYGDDWEDWWQDKPDIPSGLSPRLETGP